MGKRGKFSAEQKATIAQEYLNGKGSFRELAKKYDCAYPVIREWVARYKEGGALAFVQNEHNRSYTEELKLKAVGAYLRGEGSYNTISARFGLRSAKQLRNWVKVYNSGKGFKHKTSGGSRMTKSRRTTQEERIAIAEACLESGKDYGAIALKYDVSYQQVYTWTKKYEELGSVGLEDRRGKRTKDQTPRTELEELKIELAKVKHQLHLTEMERDLLKKLEEIERRDASQK